MVARNRVVLSGTLSGDEIWSTGVTFAGADGGVVEDQGALQQWATDVAALFPLAIQNTLGNLLSTSGILNQVSIYAYDASGPAVAQAIAPVANTDGQVTLSLPLQIAAVVSLRTTIPGASFRGRNYWPALGADLDFDGTFAPSDQAGLADSFAALLAAIGSASPNAGGSIPMVHSGVRNLLTLVSSLAVGSLPDTQRRRRNGIPESYTTVAYPPA